MSNFSVNQNHPMIPNNQTFKLDRKLISVHSEDRDVSKWPNVNEFEVKLPVDLKNVSSLRLMDVQFPVNYYVFSNNYQNTKFTFKVLPNDGIKPNNNGEGRTGDEHNKLVDNSANPYTAQISEGFYTPIRLADEIAGQMNKTVEKFLRDSSGVLAKSSGSGSWTGLETITDHTYENFRVLYDEVGLKLWFGNRFDNFTLEFDNSLISYDISSCNLNKNFDHAHYGRNPEHGPKIFDLYDHWGLGSYLGFEKKKYTAEIIPDLSGLEIFSQDLTNFEYVHTNEAGAWLIPDGSGAFTGYPNGIAYYLYAPNTLNIFGEGHVYMELDKYNSLDEIEPYSNNSNDFNKKCMYIHGRKVQLDDCQGLKNIKPNTRTANGTYKSAFAKIPVIAKPNERMYTSTGGFLSDVFYSDPPVAKVDKFKVKFRYHDGRLVDFRGANLSFTIEATELRNEIRKPGEVRMPYYAGL